MSREYSKQQRKKRAIRQARRQNPLYQALLDVIGRDQEGSQIATKLFEAGVTTPEELCRLSYVELAGITGIGIRGRTRLSGIRAALGLPGPSLMPDGKEIGTRAHEQIEQIIAEEKSQGEE